jgi:hypothetical protein
MGDLNKIQNDIALEMLGDLADVSYAFTGSRVVTGAYDPENPTSGTTETYSGTGIFGLQFTKEDSQIFQIEQNDQKAIIMKVNSSGTPQVGDDMTYSSVTYKIIHIVVIPADNGWTLQLRKV